MRAFFDTNVLVYASLQGDRNQAAARRVLAKGGFISAQVLNEFANVAHRKLNLSWPDIGYALLALRSTLQPPVPVTLSTHEQALDLAERHKLAFYDASIVASALEAKCTVLYTENMHHGMIVEGSLQIVNPFLEHDQGSGFAS